jgi:hypothetical protein
MNIHSMTIIIFHFINNVKSKKYWISFAWYVWFDVEVTPEIDTEKTKHTFVSQEQFVGQNYNTKIANKSSENLS